MFPIPLVIEYKTIKLPVVHIQDWTFIKLIEYWLFNNAGIDLPSVTVIVLYNIAIKICRNKPGITLINYKQITFPVNRLTVNVLTIPANV